MKSWYFSEQSYYPAWESYSGPPKITSPADQVDPEVAHRLLSSFLAECRLCDQLGINIMVNEHHASYTCMSVSCMVTLGILAAQTRNVRLLALGIPLLNRMDPYRIAEEIAYVDTLSRGRLEIGLIKGSAFELYMSNADPVDTAERYWEAHDLVRLALENRSGPISFEGKHFQYRYVNVIPPAYQKPYPPMWLTTLSTGTAIEAARRDMTVAITAVAPAARKSYPLYKQEYQRVHGRPAPLERMAYLAYIAVARDEKTAIERGRKILKFVEASERIEERFLFAPGLMSHEQGAQFLKAGKTVTHRTRTLPDGTPMSNPPTPQEQIINNALFAGTPDQVYRQLEEFWHSVGGFGQLLVQMGGTMSHDEICDSLTLFANEVQPRLDQLTRTQESAAA